MAATQRWNLEPDNTIVVLDGGDHQNLVQDYDCLYGWATSAFPSQLLEEEEYVGFFEPDLADELTGFAIKPGCEPKWVRSLPLLFGKGVNTNGNTHASV